MTSVQTCEMGAKVASEGLQYKIW